VPAHNLDDESTRMGRGSGLNQVNSSANPLQGRVATNCGICARQVIVDGADQADNVEVPIRSSLFFGKLSLLDELVEQRGPFGTEAVGTGERAVTTTDDEGVNAMGNEVLGGSKATLALIEGHAAGSADQGAALGEPATDVVPLHLPDQVAAADQAFVAFVDAVGIASQVYGHAYAGTHNSVHAGRVAARRHDGDLLLGRHLGSGFAVLVVVGSLGVGGERRRERIVAGPTWGKEKEADRDRKESESDEDVEMVGDGREGPKGKAPVT